MVCHWTQFVIGHKKRTSTSKLMSCWKWSNVKNMTEKGRREEKEDQLEIGVLIDFNKFYNTFLFIKGV